MVTAAIGYIPRMGAQPTNVVTVTLCGGPDDGLAVCVHETTRLLIRRHGAILHEYRTAPKHADRMTHSRVWKDEDEPEG